jgi:hypothetical protein
MRYAHQDGGFARIDQVLNLKKNTSNYSASLPKPKQ